MRLLIASMAALAAFAVAAPSFAQDETGPAAAPATTDPVPATTTKAKPGTAAYCQSLKSSSSRSSCLKKVSSAKPAAKPKGTATASKKTHKPATTPASASKAPDVGQLAPPASAPASATASAPAPTGNVAVPPLPQKTI